MSSWVRASGVLAGRTTVVGATGNVIESLDGGGQALAASSDPNVAMEMLQSQAPGHQYSDVPATPTYQPAVDSFDSSMMATPSPMSTPATPEPTMDYGVPGGQIGPPDLFTRAASGIAQEVPS